jgi:hypothetical protein
MPDSQHANKPLSDGPVDESSGKSELEREKERLMKAANDSKKKSDMTFQLSAAERDKFIDASHPAFGMRVGAVSVYHLMPQGLTRNAVEKDQPIWRIELHGLAPGAAPLGLDVAGDVVIGRGIKAETDVDVDLDLYEGFARGVSRRHAMLRPSKRTLYLLDLGSTNGTMHNAMPINQGVTRSLSSGDTLTFGQLSCTIQVIDGPAEGIDP